MNERCVCSREREGAGRGVSPKRTQGAVGARPGWYLKVVIVLLLATLVTQARVAELAFAVARAGVVAEPGRLVEAGKCKEQGQPWPHDALQPYGLLRGVGYGLSVSVVWCVGERTKTEKTKTTPPRAIPGHGPTQCLCNTVVL